MRRPFAKNTGNYIKGTEQVGNLSVGISPFSQSYSGLTWWEGPEENSVCIIAKDTTSKGSPVGNTGTVRFWGTGSTDEAFIGAVNNVSGQSFTTTSSCNEWLSNNGYWTNCGNYGSATIYSDVTIRQFPLPEYNDSVTGAGQMVFNENRNEIYTKPYRRASINEGTPPYTAIIDTSDITLGTSLQITSSNQSPSSYLSKTGSGEMYLDTTNDHLYIFSSYFYDSQPSRPYNVTKWNTSTNTLLASSSLDLGWDGTDHLRVTMDEDLGMLYVTNFNGEYDRKTVLYAITSSTLEISSSINIPDPTFGQPSSLYYCISTTYIPTNNTITSFSTRNPQNDLQKWVTLDADDFSVLSSGSFPNDLYTYFCKVDLDSFTNAIYLESTKNLYFKFRDTSKKENIGWINTETNTFYSASYGNASLGNFGWQYQSFAYDSQREVFWTLDASPTSSYLFAFDPVKEEFIKSGSIQNTIPAQHSIVDTVNSKLYIANMSSDEGKSSTTGSYEVFNLQNIWPI